MVNLLSSFADEKQPKKQTTITSALCQVAICWSIDLHFLSKMQKYITKQRHFRGNMQRAEDQM